VATRRLLKNRASKYPRWVKRLCKKCFSRYLLRTGHRKIWSIYNREQTGKTYVDRYGPELSEQIKAKLARHPGPWKGKHITSKMKLAVSKARKGKTLLEFVGSAKSARWRFNMSKAFSGERNPMFGKPAPLRSGRSVCSGYFNGVYFRSFSELCFLVSHPTAKSAEHFTAYFQFNGRLKSYHPDYIDGTKIYEIKPKAMIKIPINQLKFQAGASEWSTFQVVSPGVDFPWITYQLLFDLEEHGHIRFTRIDRSKMAT
jgi:hypothetical protein